MSILNCGLDRSDRTGMGKKDATIGGVRGIVKGYYILPWGIG